MLIFCLFRTSSLYLFLAIVVVCGANINEILKMQQTKNVCRTRRELEMIV